MIDSAMSHVVLSQSNGEVYLCKTHVLVCVRLRLWLGLVSNPVIDIHNFNFQVQSEWEGQIFWEPLTVFMCFLLAEYRLVGMKTVYLNSRPVWCLKTQITPCKFWMISSLREINSQQFFLVTLYNTPTNQGHYSCPVKWNLSVLCSIWNYNLIIVEIIYKHLKVK